MRDHAGYRLRDNRTFRVAPQHAHVWDRVSAFKQYLVFHHERREPGFRVLIITQAVKCLPQRVDKLLSGEREHITKLIIPFTRDISLNQALRKRPYADIDPAADEWLEPGVDRERMILLERYRIETVASGALGMHPVGVKAADPHLPHCGNSRDHNNGHN